MNSASYSQALGKLHYHGEITGFRFCLFNVMNVKNRLDSCTQYRYVKRYVKRPAASPGESVESGTPKLQIPANFVFYDLLESKRNVLGFITFYSKVS